MRKILTFAMAVLAILSCSRESIDSPQEEPLQPEKKTINLTIVAGNPSDCGTRTELVGTTPYWSEYDNLGVTSLTMDAEYFDEYGEESYDRNIFEISGDSFPVEVANFNGQIDVADNDHQTLYAYYPGIPAYRYFDYSVFDEAPDYYGPIDNWFFDILRFDDELVGPRVLVSKFQQPTSTSFDEAADVLVAEPFSLSDCNYDDDEERYTLPNLKFARMVSVIELYLNSGENGPFEGLQPEYVELGYEGNDAIPLTGPAFIEFPKTNDDVPALHPCFEGWPSVDKTVYAYLGAYSNNSPEGPDGPVDPEGPVGQVNRYTITAQPDDGPFINPIYLVVFPGTLKAGGDLTIYAANMDGYFGIGRSIHLKNNIVLQPGKITTLVVDMTGNEDDLIIEEKNTPGSIELEPVIHVDQYDNVELVASVFGKNTEGEIDVDNSLFTCTFRDENGDYKDIDYSLSYSYFDEKVTISMPQLDEVGDLIVQVCYGTISSNECSLIVHEAVEIPAVLADNWKYSYQYTSSWFVPYRIDRRDIDGKVYLRTYAASQREDPLPPYAFYHAISEGDACGFDAFQYFSQLTVIPSYAFWYCQSMNGIVLPSGIKSIKERAFQYCCQLESIDLPSGLTSIGNYAFSDCSRLTSLHLPDGVTSIGDFVFSACWDFASINLENVLSIGQSAFSGCSLEGDLYIGGATIGNNAFQGNSDLQNVTIANYTAPDKDATIGAGAFSNCSNLSFVNLPNNVSLIGDSAFENCSRLTSITLPTDLEVIGSWAFSNTGLTSVIIPSSVNSINAYAFDGCQMEYYEMAGSTPPRIWDESLVFPSTDTFIYVDDSAVEEYTSKFAEWGLSANIIARVKPVSEKPNN